MELDILPNLFAGMGNLFQFGNFSLLVVGSLVGVIAGALPGITFVNAMALALPFAYFMSPISAMRPSIRWTRMTRLSASRRFLPS